MEATPRTARVILAELVERVGACRGGDTYFSADEMAHWPGELASAIRSARLLLPASRSTSTECPGCEQACWMDVHVVPGPDASGGRAFVMCDKRDDIARVVVPIERLDRMKSSGQVIADAVAPLLKMELGRPVQIEGCAWHLGTFEGARHKSPLALSFDMEPRVVVAGHAVRLVELLRFDKGRVSLDVSAVRKLVDSPSGRTDDAPESPADRAARLHKRITQLKAQGVRDFRKRLAEEEGIDPSRIGQILRKYAEPKLTTTWFPQAAAPKPRSPAKARKK